MNEQDMATLAAVRKEVAELPAFKRQQVEQAARMLREFIVQRGQVGIVAFGLVGAELQADELQLFPRVAGNG
jgi:hypothetical protein